MCDAFFSWDFDWKSIYRIISRIQGHLQGCKVNAKVKNVKSLNLITQIGRSVIRL